MIKSTFLVIIQRLFAGLNKNEKQSIILKCLTKDTSRIRDLAKKKRMKNILWLSALILFSTFSCAQQKNVDVNNSTKTGMSEKELEEVLTSLPPVLNEGSYNELTEFESYVIDKKGTERSYSGDYHSSKKTGVYICRRCNLPLFSSIDKFESGTGWPSFDDEVNEEAVREETDKDGRRTEILCNHCDGHLGHVFKNEGMTSKNTRHCVNSASINFVEGIKP